MNISIGIQTGSAISSEKDQLLELPKLHLSESPRESLNCLFLSPSV
jgi:hypothetical protein